MIESLPCLFLLLIISVYVVIARDINGLAFPDPLDTTLTPLNALAWGLLLIEFVARISTLTRERDESGFMKAEAVPICFDVAVLLGLIEGIPPFWQALLSALGIPRSSAYRFDYGTLQGSFGSYLVVRLPYISPLMLYILLYPVYPIIVYPIPVCAFFVQYVCHVSNLHLEYKTVIYMLCLFIVYFVLFIDHNYLYPDSSPCWCSTFIAYASNG